MVAIVASAIIMCRRPRMRDGEGNVVGRSGERARGMGGGEGARLCFLSFFLESFFFFFFLDDFFSFSLGSDETRRG